MTTKYRRHQLWSTCARPAQIPRSHRHSRSGLSSYSDIGSSNGKGTDPATPSTDDRDQPLQQVVGRAGQNQARRPYLKVERRVGMCHEADPTGISSQEHPAFAADLAIARVRPSELLMDLQVHFFLRIVAGPPGRIRAATPGRPDHAERGCGTYRVNTTRHGSSSWLGDWKARRPW